MKDKEKQIEEMAKIMCGNDCEECAKESAEFYKQTLEEARNNKCLLKNCAKTLYEQGYRKLPEDSVVLSREEYIDLSRNYVGEQVAQARKETAEKIYTKIKDSFLMNSNNRYALKLWIEEQFGLEIKE